MIYFNKIRDIIFRNIDLLFKTSEKLKHYGKKQNNLILSKDEKYIIILFIILKYNN